MPTLRDHLPHLHRSLVAEPTARARVVRALGNDDPHALARALKRAGADIDAMISLKRPGLLLEACKRNALACARYLLNERADPRRVDHRGRSAAMLAASTDRTAFFALLRERAPSTLIETDASYRTPLAVAVYRPDNHPSVRAFIEREPALLREHERQAHRRCGASASLSAALARQGAAALLDALIEQIGGALANAPHADTRDALHYACATGQTHTARRLLAAGADPNRMNSHHELPLVTAVRADLADRGETTRILLAHGARYDPEDTSFYSAASQIRRLNAPRLRNVDLLRAQGREALLRARLETAEVPPSPPSDPPSL